MYKVLCKALLAWNETERKLVFFEKVNIVFEEVNMKKMRLPTKRVKVAGKEEEMHAKELSLAALSNYQEALKGIKNVRTAIKVYEKIENSRDGSTIDLEDAEFDLLYKAIDNMTWGGLALQFGEFFDEIEGVKAS
jgi:hypothetical protein